MEFGLIEKIKKSPKEYEFLKRNSYFYRYLNRNPEYYKEFIKAFKSEERNKKISINTEKKCLNALFFCVTMSIA